MKFTQEDIKILTDCANNKTRVVVSGKNALGQEFSTEGYVLTNFKSRGRFFGLSEFGFDLFTGQTHIDILGEKLKQSVRIYSHADIDRILQDKLYVKSVSTKQGEIIYINPNFDDIINLSLAVLATKEYCSNWLHEPLTDYAQKLTTLIGKPVVFENEKHVVIRTVSVRNGSVCADTTDGYYYMGFTNLKDGDVQLDKKAYDTLDRYGANAQLKDDEVLGK